MLSQFTQRRTVENKPSALREFLQGAKTLFQGFLWFRKHPKAMLMGLIPAAIVGSVLGTVLIVLFFNVGSIVSALIGFTEGWANGIATAVEIAIGVALIGGSIVGAVLSFTALTLIVGDSFYTKIWEEVEVSENGVKPEGEPTFVDGLKDGLSLFGKGILVAIIALLLGLVPLIGAWLSTVVGSALTGLLLADELTGRAMNARGISHKTRSAFIRNHRPRAIGFGVATQLCFMVPLGAVFVMPAAVVGSTKLAAHVGNFEENTNI